MDQFNTNDSFYKSNGLRRSTTFFQVSVLFAKVGFPIIQLPLTLDSRFVTPKGY